MSKKMLGLLAAALVILGIMQTAILTVAADRNQAQAAIRSDFTDAFNLVRTMQIGWNLGNALDSINGAKGNSVQTTETCWGNPVTTKRMIEMVSDAGFKTVRVPVTYFGNSDWDANIDKEWLDRVQEVVDYVLDCNMYCIINVHHDTGKGAWISPDTEKYENSSYRMRRLWQQIAERFKDYDNRLIFEGMNEILNSKEQWTEASNENYANVNKLNQIFVDTVRASGGNNSKRFLMVPLYAAIVSQQNINGFVLPKDTISNHLIISYHSYDTDNSRINATFALVKSAFLDKGVPAVLGEFGMRNNTNEDNTSSRITYINKVVSDAKALGIACIWWDDGGYFASANKVTNYCLLDRYSYRWNFPQLVCQLISASAPSNGASSNGNASSDDASSQDAPAVTSKPADTSETGTASDTGGTSDMSAASNTSKMETTSTEMRVQSTFSNPLSFSRAGMGVKTDISLGMDCDYEFIFSIDNRSGYGDLMVTYDGSRIGYRVRQELGQVYTAYGYNNFKAIDLEPNRKYTVAQKGGSTYVDGTLIMHNIGEDFGEGVLTIGDCRMTFYGMKITKNGKVVHRLVPGLDASGKSCIRDEVSGTCYEANVDTAYTAPETTTTTAPVTTTTATTTTATTTTTTTTTTATTATTTTTKPTTTVTGPVITPFVQTPLDDGSYTGALLFPTMTAGIETDITLGVGCEYDFICSLDNASRYGNLMLTHDGKRIGYRVRQELSQIYTAYGYNNFKALDIVPGQMYTVSQKGDNTYVDGQLIMRNITQNFNEGKLTIGNCRMIFYGMTIKQNGKVTHKLEPSKDASNTPCILDRMTGRRYYSNNHIMYGFLVPGTTDFRNLYPVTALSIPKMCMGIETDITLGVGCEYDFAFSLDNASRYGNLMLTHDGSRIGYRVRQELSRIYTAYGYNNFRALDIEPGRIYTVSQKGDDTYVDGNLIMHNVTQNFHEGTLTIGDCRMKFYGMTVTEGDEITHKLVPSIDEMGKPCIFDEVTGKLYYSKYDISFIK